MDVPRPCCSDCEVHALTDHDAELTTQQAIDRLNVSRNGVHLME